MATHDDQLRLIEAMSRMGSAGRAEGEDDARLASTFWPVPEHLRAFDPDVVLVVGPRGAGKTELFRAVIERGLLPTLSARIPGVRLPPVAQTQWLAGYPIGSEFPSDRLLREFAHASRATDELLLDVWLAYLVRVLKAELHDASLNAVFAPQGGDVEQVLAAFRANAKAALLALDALDQRLLNEGRHIIVAYDELDTLARNDADLTRLAVRGLVALWQATQGAGSGCAGRSSCAPTSTSVLPRRAARTSQSSRPTAPSSRGATGTSTRCSCGGWPTPARI